MDPALREVLGQGSGHDEVEAVVRLTEDAAGPPPGLRIVAQFDGIATCRLRRADIPAIWEHPWVASLKAARVMGPEAVMTHDGVETPPRHTDLRRPPGLAPRGGGVVLGLLDWGFDFRAPSLRTPSGTRLVALWDQRDRPGWRQQNVYGYGTIHTRAAINRALASRDPYATLRYHPADADPYGVGAHGTAVADLAAGNGGPGGPPGVAPDVDIVFVHLSSRGTAGLATLGDSIGILEGLDFIRRMADGRPTAISLSVGRHGGPHDGCTLVELAFDAFLSARGPRVTLSQSAGNYRLKQTHVSAVLAPGTSTGFELIVDAPDPSVNELEIWHEIDRCAVRLDAPGGTSSGWVTLGASATLVQDARVIARVYHRESDPQNGSHHVDAFIYPGAPAGAWLVGVRDERSAGLPRSMHAWVERDDACTPCQSRFRSAVADPTGTLGTLANGRLPIVCGAFDGHDPDRPPAHFSSVGPTRDGRRKPDISAAGVGVLTQRSEPRTPGPYDSSVRKSGTSMAAPQIAGCTALLLQVSEGRLSHADIKDIVLSTAEPARVPDPEARLGAGYVDIARAVAVARQIGRRHFVELHTRTPHHADAATAMETQMDGDEGLSALLDDLDRCVDRHRGRVAREDAFLTRLVGRANDGLTADRLFRRAIGGIPPDGVRAVAGPGEAPGVVQAGDVLVRIGLGEPGLGHVAVVVDGVLRSAAELAADGFSLEAMEPGLYAHVIDAGDVPHVRASRFARRLVDASGRLPPGQLLLRSSHTGPMPGPEDKTRDEEAPPHTGACTQGRGLVGDRDGRSRVARTTDVPFRWVCQISVRMRKNGAVRRFGPAGSGVLISPRHVLTAAHVLRASERDDKNQWVELEADHVVVTPARNDDASADARQPFGSFEAKSWTVSPRYDPRAADAWKYDYALITLKEEAGAATSPLIGTKALGCWGGPGSGATWTSRLDAAVLEGRTAFTAGYPFDRGKGTSMFSSSGALSGVDLTGRGEVMNIRADACDGQSGGPVWVTRDGQPHLVGLMKKIATGTANSALRLDQAALDQLTAWLQPRASADATADGANGLPVDPSGPEEDDDLPVEESSADVSGELAEHDVEDEPPDSYVTEEDEGWARIELDALEEATPPPAHRFRVVDAADRPLAGARYTLHQASTTEAGTLDAQGEGAFGRIDPGRAFRLSVEGRVCAIVEGAVLLVDEPGVEYGGQFVDWREADAPDADTGFWPHYSAERSAEPVGPLLFWQHDHAMRRPIKVRRSYVGSRRTPIFQAVPLRMRVGPLMRFVDAGRALVWVELETPGLVRVRYRKADHPGTLLTAKGPLPDAGTVSRHRATVRVGGRHFALVLLDGLDADTFYAYTIDLAPLPAVTAIPRAEAEFTESVFPASLPPAVTAAHAAQLVTRSFRGDRWLFFRTLRAEYQQLRFAHGSCRKWPGDTDEAGKTPGPDMLGVFGSAWLATKNPVSEWPRFFLHTGDQIYADDVGVKQGERIMSQRFASVVPGPRARGDLTSGAWAGRFADRYVAIDAQRTAREAAPTRALKERANQLEAEIAKARRSGQLDREVLRLGREYLVTRKALSQQPGFVRAWRFVDPKRPMRFRQRIENALLWEVPNARAAVPDVSLTGLRHRDPQRSYYPSAGDTNAVHAADFAEYGYLYQAAWSTEHARKVLAHLPSFMIFDDHEVTDDWNFNREWVEIVHDKSDLFEMWPKTITDALAAYWMYQGWGNLAPETWPSDPRTQILLRASADGRDALPELRKLILERATRPAAPGSDPRNRLVWHYALPIRSPQFLVVDDRTDREIAGSSGPFQAQLAWLRSRLTAETSAAAFIVFPTPYLLAHPLSWAMAHPGATRVIDFFNSLRSRRWDWKSIAELSRGADLEHAAGNQVWDDVKGMLTTLQDSVTSLKTIAFLSGDIHFSCNLDGRLKKFDPPPPPHLLQLVSSGLRQSVSSAKQNQLRFAYRYLWFETTGTHRDLSVRLAGLDGPGGDDPNFLFAPSVALVDVDLRKKRLHPRMDAELPNVSIHQQHLTWKQGPGIETYDFWYANNEATGPTLLTPARAPR